MNLADQELADAAIDSYNNRPEGDLNPNHPGVVVLNDREYQIFGYANNPITGFHATAYQQVGAPHDIIIAYRGTDPGLFSGKDKAEKADHALTTVQDIAVDATMVRDAVNPQRSAADAFTQAMIDKAARQGIPKDQIAVAGHSLGGTLAEIEAAKYGLTGSTFNAYGAVDLTDGPPQPGCHLTNYRMAGDVVSAANPHVGTVVPLASQQDVQSLRDGRYLDAPVGAPPPNALIAMRLGDHGVGHFHDGPDNVLAPHRFQEAAQRYADNKAAFDRFSGDVSRERGELSLALRQMQVPDSHAHLPPDIQRQVNEYLALHADQPVHDAIVQSGIAQDIERTLQQGADVTRAGGHSVQALDEHIASVTRATGNALWPLNPAAPLAGALMGEMAHLHGQAADATGHVVGNELQSAKGTVERGTRRIAQVVVGEIHDPDVQTATTNVVNRIVNTYHDVQSTGQAITQTYEAVRQTAGRDIDALEHAAGQAYDTLAHPERLFHRDVAPARPTRPETPPPALTPPLNPPALRDFRHPDHPLHARYTMFRDALGEQGFHQDRPTLNAVPDVRHYSPGQKDRLAAGFTAQVGTDARFNSEVQQFRKDGGALLAIEHPRRLGDTPLVLAVPEAASLAKTPEEHAATWRARELPEQHPVNTQRPDPRSLSPDHFAHPTNPHHALFEHARHALTSEYARWGMQKDAGQIDRETVQVMTAARHGQLLDVGAVRFTKMPEASGLGEHPNMAVYESPKGPQQGLSAMVCCVRGQTLQQAPPIQQAAQQFHVIDQRATQKMLTSLPLQAQQGQALGR